MHGAECMMESRMYGTWIDKICHSQLFDPPQSLEYWMFNQLHDDFKRHRYEAVDGVVDDLPAFHKLIAKSKALNNS